MPPRSIPISEFELRRNPPLADAALNDLFAASWSSYRPRRFGPVLERSLVYIAAFSGERLAGFVNVAWDGGIHGFVLDTTVHPDYRRRGIALALLEDAARAAGDHRVEWLHVDFVPELEALYRRAGYRPTEAGLLAIKVGAA